MSRDTFRSTGVALLAALAGACTSDVPSPAGPTAPALAKPSAGFTALNVGALLGDYTSVARAVNDAGHLVGHYCCDPDTRAFALISGVPVKLGGGRGAAWGMSNGSPAFVAGSAGVSPARWSLADPAQPVLLERTAGEVTAGATGTARGVNDAGAAVGNVGTTPAMWATDGTREANPITTPAGYVRGEGRGINDDGLAIFQFFAAGGETAISRAYVRLASGVPVELPPLGNDVTSFANDISEVGSGTVYIAGTTRSSTLVSRSVRWTVDASTGAIIATDVLSTTGAHGLGVSDAGGIAGFTENLRSLRFAAYLWRGTDVLELAPPKGGKNGRAWGLSQSGEYVAGEASFTGAGAQAVRWTMTSP